MIEIRGKNEYEHIILKWNEKINEFEDITKQVIYIKEDVNTWYVVFDNHKAYYFKSKNIKVGVNPKQVDTFGKKVYINHNMAIVFKIFKYNGLGYKLFLENHKTLFVNTIKEEPYSICIDNIDISLPKTGNKVFDYYRALSKYASDVSCDDGSIEKLMFNLYKKIDQIDSQSVLFSYTNERYRNRKFDFENLIFPFKTNFSQIEAVKKAFMHNISVISGPPGTGKTQVILNIIANAIIQNQKVAVISNNNTAVENVYIKLKQYGYDFILAHLGNAKNVENFFTKKDDLDDRLHNLGNVTDTNQKVGSMILKLQDLYIKQNQLQQLKKAQFELENEYRHYCEKYDTNEYGYHFTIHTYEKALQFRIDILSKKMNIFRKIYIWFKYRVYISKDYHLDELCIYLEKLYYRLKIEKIKQEIAKLEDHLKEEQLDGINKSLEVESNRIFQQYLIHKYKNMETKHFTKENYKDMFSDFLE